MRDPPINKYYSFLTHTVPPATYGGDFSFTPAEAMESYGDAGSRAMAALRHDPASLFAENSDPLALARRLLSQSVTRYEQGAASEAQQLAVTS